MTNKEVIYSKEEQKNSSRIFKSATPKYTTDWYIKWIASAFVLVAMSLRGIEGYQFIDLSLSVIGIFLWFAVGVMWKDKAIMVVHVGAFISLFLGYLYS